MIKIKRLIFNNIGRFVEEQTVDFEGLQKLTQFDGKNNNTGGSSGSGKSTIFHAIDYAFGINEIPATSLQSRNTKESLYAKLYMEVDGKEFSIVRGKKEGLVVVYGEEKIEANSKLAEEKIDEVISIPRPIFKKMLHKKQKEGGFFLQLTAKESYDFLIRSLGLENSEKTIDKIDLDIKEQLKKLQELTNNKNTNESIVSTLKSQLDSLVEVDTSSIPEKKEKLSLLETRMGSLHQLEQQINKEKIDELVKHTSTQPSESIDTSHYSKEIEALEEAKMSFLNDKRSKIENIQKDIKTLNSELNNINSLENNVNSMISECKKLMVEKESIDALKCPTCLQIWHDDRSKLKSESIIEKLKQNKDSIIANKQTISLKEAKSLELAEMSSKLKLEQDNNPMELDDKIKEINNKRNTLLSSHNKIMEGFYTRQREIERTHNALLDSVKLRKEEAHVETLRLETEVKRIEIDQSRLAELKTNLSKNMDDLQIKLNTISDDIVRLNKRILVAEESKRAIKSFNLSVFQDTLEEIGEYASSILSSIPNMSNASISFQTSKETKTGKIKEEINAMLSLDGEEDINIKTLSGGERTACDLAVDLAVIDVLEAKANKGTDLFILDEPFTGLEEQNIEKCLHIICKVDTNKKILIVDHNPVVKQMVYGTINVERHGDTSRIVNG